MLEVRVVGDLGHELLAELVLERADEAGDEPIPLADGLRQRFHVTLSPEFSFVADFVQQAELLGMVQQRDDRQVATQEVLHAAAVGVASVLGFASDHVADVTWRYVSDFKQTIQRRNINEKQLVKFIYRINRILQAQINQQRKKTIIAL